MKRPKSRSGVALASFGVAAALALSACGGSAPIPPAPVSNTAAVRTVVEQFMAASYAGDGATFCSLLTPASQRAFATASSSSGGPATCAAAAVAAFTSASSTRESLAQINKSLAAAPVVVTGDSASITADILGSKGTTSLILVGGHWLLDLASTLTSQTAKYEVSVMEQQEVMSYNAAYAAAVFNTPQGALDTGTKLLKDIASSEPTLANVVTVSVEPTATNKLISLAETTPTTFVAVGVTLSGQTVTYTVPPDRSAAAFAVTG